MPPDIVVLDTCVLISSVLRRLLLRLADQACFRPAWSDVIGQEWRRNAARLWDAPAEDVARQWAELQQAFPLADQGDVAAFKQGLRHSDPKDWHVIAAARAVLAGQPGASVAVVTRNVRDFNRSELRRLGLALLDPDQLLVRCWASRADSVRAAFAQIEQELVLEGKPVEPLEVVLKRERLFRLNKLCAARHGEAAGL